MEKWMVILPEGPLSTLLHRVGHEYYHSHAESRQVLQGPPSVHVWAALVLFLARHEKLQRTSELLRDHAATVHSPDDLIPLVHVCEINKVHAAGKHRLVISVADSLRPILVVIAQCLKELGAGFRSSITFFI
eukprot:13241100-Heterocapsa_arctica.AAC.1